MLLCLGRTISWNACKAFLLLIIIIIIIVIIIIINDVAVGMAAGMKALTSKERAGGLKSHVWCGLQSCMLAS